MTVTLNGGGVAGFEMSPIGDSHQKTFHIPKRTKALTTN